MPTLATKSTIPLFRRLLFQSAAYGWALGFSHTDRIRAIDIAFPGDPERGQRIRVSELIETIKADPKKTDPEQTSIDQFAWLADLQASGLETSGQFARDITKQWISTHNKWTADHWQFDLLAERICAWISAAPYLLAGANSEFEITFASALSRQSNHLLYAIQLGEPLQHGFGIQKALIYCGVALAGRTRHLAYGLDLLEKSVGDEIHADGGHKSRNPLTHLTALSHLIEIRNALGSQSAGSPIWLQSSIDKMTPMLRAFVLGDGQLAAFNGGSLSDASFVSAVIKASGATGRAVTNAPHSGFQRLSGRRAIVLMDAGSPANNDQQINGNAGTLSFEMSVSKQRLIVNCGLPAGNTPHLTAALQGTAAHSTLTMNETNSSQINPNGLFGPRRAARTQALRREVEKNTLVEATHDGYLSLFGATHKRSLFLSADGDEVRGEDLIQGSTPQECVIRFHLHPSVQASLVEAGDSILLRFGKLAGWRFRTSNKVLQLEPSIYFDKGVRRQCQQIVLAFQHKADETIIKWRLSKEAAA